VPLDPQYCFTFLVMLVVGLLICRLVAHASLQTELAAGIAMPEDRELPHAMANQAALAPERTLFERRSAQAVVDAETERLQLHTLQWQAPAEAIVWCDRRCCCRSR
jgi:K+-sensing histidine kinase KdpD